MTIQSQPHDRGQEPGGCGVSSASRLTLEQAIERLDQTYRARGWSRDLWANDRALLRRIGKAPDEIELQDLERVIMAAHRQSTRAQYAARIHSLLHTMRQIGITDNCVDERLPRIRKPRAVPRPLTKAEASMLMSEARQPMRDWFILGCMAGLRACEIARVRGSDLYRVDGDRYELRVQGKGNTDLVVPVLPAVVEVFERNRTLGPLWQISHPRKVSARAGVEMRRLGIPPERAKFHACRHYFATALLEASGWDLLTTSRLMRHANINPTTGYTALREDRPSQVLEMLEKAS